MKSSKQKKPDLKLKKKNTNDKNVAPNNIHSYFQPTIKNNEDNVNSTQNIYVEALKKKLRDASTAQRTDNAISLNNKEEADTFEVVGCETNAKEDQISKLLGADCIDEVAKNDRTFKDVGGYRVDDSETVRSSFNVAEHSSVCTNAGCVQKALECQEWERKYKEMKKVYLNLTINYTEENIKYKNLLKATTLVTNSNNCGGSSSSDGIFTSNELKALQHIPLDKPKDSTFIMECLQYAYKTNLADLCRRTLKGTSEKVEFNEKGEEVKRQPAKSAMTPEKTTRIKQLFIDRIAKCNIDSSVNRRCVYESTIFVRNQKHFQKVSGGASLK